MRRVASIAVCAALTVLGIGLQSGFSAADQPTTPPGVSNRPTCPGGQPAETARCFARVVTDAIGRPLASTTPRPGSKGPAEIQSAYALSGAATNPPSGPTVAIVDAYNDPAAESDLAVYRQQYGLPPCTTANKCFRKVNQSGGSVMPRTDAGWSTEISLDLDAVSAACPNCKILLVEANTPSFANLGAAVNYAATQGVAAISNSYGGSDTSTNLTAYNHPGIAVTASTGDNGYGVESPASSPYVIAVGGTSLTKATGTTRGWTESAWSGAGSGCSAYQAKTTWQPASVPCGTKRGVADVSAVADPYTGLSVYDSVRYQGASGWQQYGGTSLSAPILGAVYAVGGNHGYSNPAQFTYQYLGSGALNDVTTGSNGTCSASITVMCHAAAGYDGPTGIGTPNGTAAF